MKIGRRQGFAWSNVQEDKDLKAELLPHSSMHRRNETLVHGTLPHPSPRVFYYKLPRQSHLWYVLKINQVGLDWLLALEICSPPASHGSCSFSMEMAVSGEGTHSVLSTGVKLQWEPWGCSQQPHPKGRSLSRLWGAWQSLIPWGKVPAQLGTSPGLCRSVPASQQCPTSTPLPKTQALSTAELIWSNIYSVIKKLFISLSDDKIMVE